MDFIDRVARSSFLFVAILAISVAGSSSACRGAFDGGHGGHMSHGGSSMPYYGGDPSGKGGPLSYGSHNPHVINYNPTIYYGYGPGGGFVYSPPLIVIAPGGYSPFYSPIFFPQPMPEQVPSRGGLMLPLPPQQPFAAAANPPRPRRVNSGRAREVVEIGDRSFRAGNIKRAEEKYQIAVKADPTAPIPHVHMAQVSIARGDYRAAADHLRDAVTVAVNAGWLINTPDIQAIFGEPADFAKQIARLESHLQTNPNDRDAWFVLGAELYLSGRNRQASDVFQRLSDRRPDEALTAFLDASNTKLPPPPATAN